MAETKSARRRIWWLLTFVWAAVIFWLSTGGFNGEWSYHLLVTVLNALHIQLSDDLIRTLHVTCRKMAHASEYAVFAFLLYQSLKVWSSDHRKAAAGAILGAGLYSLFDEFHQSLVPGRTASLIDSGIDTLGAALAMALVYWLSFRPSRKVSA